MDKKEIILKWSEVYSLNNFKDNKSLHKLLNNPGIYVNIVTKNENHRITYIGESDNMFDRWYNDSNSYYKEYYFKNGYHTMDISKINQDPNELYWPINSNSYDKLLKDKICFKDKIPKNEWIIGFDQMRKDYFQKSYMAFTTSESTIDFNVKINRKYVQRNIQKYFVDKKMTLPYNETDFIIGLCNSETKYFKNDYILLNQFEDIGLSDLPAKIEFNEYDNLIE